MTRRHLVPVVAAFFALTACGGSTDDGTGNSASDTTPSQSSHPTASESDKLTAVKQATCKLKGPETADVTLQETGDGLVATFEGQPVRPSGSTFYSVTAFDQAGEEGVQLGMKFLDAELIGYFVFDIGLTQQANLDGSPDLTGKTVRGFFPIEELGTLGKVGAASWSASFSLDGTDVGLCPGDYESQPFPG